MADKHEIRVRDVRDWAADDTRFLWGWEPTPEPEAPDVDKLAIAHADSRFCAYDCDSWSDAYQGFMVGWKACEDHYEGRS